MKLVIGGAFQGKKLYASERYQIPEGEWIDGSTCEKEMLFSAKAINHFHEYIRKRQKAGENLMKLAEELLEKNPEIILVTNEVGYGIVPMEKENREWREACGRVCTVLASGADEVVRVCCGIGTKIK